MVEIKVATYTYNYGGVIGIPVARWLAWYLPSTAVSCIWLTINVLWLISTWNSSPESSIQKVRYKSATASYLG